MNDVAILNVVDEVFDVDVNLDVDSVEKDVRR